MTNKGLISSLQLLLKWTNIQKQKKTKQNIQFKATKTLKRKTKFFALLEFFVWSCCCCCCCCCFSKASSIYVIDPLLGK